MEVWESEAARGKELEVGWLERHWKARSVAAHFPIPFSLEFRLCVYCLFVL